MQFHLPNTNVVETHGTCYESDEALRVTLTDRLPSRPRTITLNITLNYLVPLSKSIYLFPRRHFKEDVIPYLETPDLNVAYPYSVSDDSELPADAI